MPRIIFLLQFSGFLGGADDLTQFLFTCRAAAQLFGKWDCRFVGTSQISSVESIWSHHGGGVCVGGCGPQKEGIVLADVRLSIQGGAGGGLPFKCRRNPCLIWGAAAEGNARQHLFTISCLFLRFFSGFSAEQAHTSVPLILLACDNLLKPPRAPPHVSDQLRDALCY